MGLVRCSELPEQGAVVTDVAVANPTPFTIANALRMEEDVAATMQAGLGAAFPLLAGAHGVIRVEAVLDHEFRRNAGRVGMVDQDLALLIELTDHCSVPREGGRLLL